MDKINILRSNMTLTSFLIWNINTLMCVLSTTGKCHLYISRENVYSNDHLAMAFQTNSAYKEKANRMSVRLLIMFFGQL